MSKLSELKTQLIVLDSGEELLGYLQKIESGKRTIPTDKRDLEAFFTS